MKISFTISSAKCNSVQGSMCQWIYTTCNSLILWWPPTWLFINKRDAQYPRQISQSRNMPCFTLYANLSTWFQFYKIDNQIHDMQISRPDSSATVTPIRLSDFTWIRSGPKHWLGRQPITTKHDLNVQKHRVQVQWLQKSFQSVVKQLCCRDVIEYFRHYNGITLNECTDAVSMEQFVITMALRTRTLRHDRLSSRCL